MAELQNARIDELPDGNPIVGDFFVFRDMLNSSTKRTAVEQFLPSQITQNFEWLSDTIYNEDEVVTYAGLWFQSLINGNINIIPGSDPTKWVEVNKAITGLRFWQAGVYAEDVVFIVNTLDGWQQLFYLDEITRPFNSTDFYAEFAANQWVLASERGYEAILKTTHGFAFGDILVRSGGAWVKRSSSSQKSLAIVKQVVSPDIVIVQILGTLSKNFTGLVDGTVYYIQANGTFSTTVTSDALMVAISTTSAIILAGSGGTGDPSLQCTGVTGGTGVSINGGDNTKFDINVQGQIVDPVTFAVTTINKVQTGIAVANLAQKVTYVGIDASSNVIQQADPFTTEQRYAMLGEFVLVHTNGTNLNAINNYPNIKSGLAEQLHSYMRSFGMTNIAGNVITPNGANLLLNKSAGRLQRVGAGNFDSDNPNEIVTAETTGFTFRYRNQNSAEGSDITTIDVTNYDVGGITTVMATNKFKVDRIALFTSNLVRIQRGQHQYDTLADAINGIISDDFILEDNIKDNGVIICFLVVKKGITNLTAAISTGDAKIVLAGRFGNSTFGGSVSPDATETIKGIIRIATQAETDTGTDDLISITPFKLSRRTTATVTFDTTLVSDIITLDASSRNQVTFVESAQITEAKTWVFSNLLNGSNYYARFSVDGLHTQTLPATVKLGDNFNASWDNSLKQWTPLTAGEYLINIVAISGTFNVRISGPYT